ncbi:alpha/beta fold hydrolase [Acidipropionibacterium jensenii]|uniref:alpha/beta fold hydrolase n=1 Tax=Acidipropionibacterium jensenii TaxID=1749 RepID=UPI002647AB02|nr:alpha/beta fold hydrolase [Acidipropionibacterium jensenii]MDN6426053.1 alpha/beta hydrolase [Acidipropionibacterium jensenii]
MSSRSPPRPSIPATVEDWERAIPGLLTRDIRLLVPLDHSNPADPRTIEVYARVVATPDGTRRPSLLFLQGGPGCESPRPTLSDPGFPGWLGRALEDYQLVLLDQRGTGLSSPVSEPVGSPADQAEYLTHLRADEIVEDCEDLRRHLGVERWAVLGQSFGGFTMLRYLSVHSESMSAGYFTGGLSAVGRHADEVYRTTYATMATKSEQYYARFPGDRDRIRELLELAADGGVSTPNGDLVSPSRVRSLGHLLGASGGAGQLHYLLEREPSSRAFRYDLAEMLPFGGRNALYAVIHESSYADGCTTAWSAARTLPESFEQDPTLLTGEHLLPGWFDEDSSLRPWKETAEIVADHPWPTLYDADALAASQVPCAAAVYFNDAYVPLQFSMETAALIPGMHPWVTSQYEHNGSNASGGAVLDRLITLARGEIAR